MSDDTQILEDMSDEELQGWLIRAATEELRAIHSGLMFEYRALEERHIEHAAEAISKAIREYIKGVQTAVEMEAEDVD